MFQEFLQTEKSHIFSAAKLWVGATSEKHQQVDREYPSGTPLSFAQIGNRDVSADVKTSFTRDVLEKFERLRELDLQQRYISESPRQKEEDIQASPCLLRFEERLLSAELADTCPQISAIFLEACFACAYHLTSPKKMVQWFYLCGAPDRLFPAKKWPSPG